MRHSKLVKALIIAFTLGMFAVANAADIKAVKYLERFQPLQIIHFGQSDMVRQL